MRFEIYKDKAGQFRWRLVAANGRIIADSAESYWNKGDCVSAVSAIKAGAAAAPVIDTTSAATGIRY